MLAVTTVSFKYMPWLFWIKEGMSFRLKDFLPKLCWINQTILWDSTDQLTASSERITFTYPETAIMLDWVRIRTFGWGGLPLITSLWGKKVDTGFVRKVILTPRSKQFFINNGNGWSLRNYSKVKFDCEIYRSIRAAVPLIPEKAANTTFLTACGCSSETRYLWRVWLSWAFLRWGEVYIHCNAGATLNSCVNLPPRTKAQPGLDQDFLFSRT